ncbi:MAG: chorismate synthase [bacterium]
MPGNSFGRMFKITSWGESHGENIGVVIDGCPAGLELSEKDIQGELDRRRPGQSRLSTSRKESDRVRIVSGVFEGKTLGTPLTLILENKDASPEDYEELKDKFRPSHADFTYRKKYGHRTWVGGGRASARETAARVAAGAVARRWLKKKFGLQINAWVKKVHQIQAADIDPEEVNREAIEANTVRCPDPETAKKMIATIEQAKEEGDSLGGVVEFAAVDCPAGWGEPVFDKLEALLGHQLLSIPASKGFEIGSGFAGTNQTGSEHNDEFIEQDGEIKTTTNNSGGVQGGISNGMPIIGRVAFKPTPTISKEQKTVTTSGDETTLSASGRHDPCVLPRAVPIVEAGVALVLADLALQQGS